MTKSKKKSIQFQKTIELKLSPEEIKQCQSLINLYWLGDKECNTLDPETKEIVPKYPDKDCPELNKAHWRINAVTRATVTIEIDVYGNLKIVLP